MRTAYVFSAAGEAHEKMMKYSEYRLKKVIPEAEVFEIGADALNGIYNEPDAIWFAYLTIPLDIRLEGFDKAVFLDADCEVVKPEFKEFFDRGDNVEVWGVETRRFCRPWLDLWDINPDRKQLNGGCVGFNLRNIDKEDWRRRITAIAHHPRRRWFRSRDEGWLFYMTNPETVEWKFNNNSGRIWDDTTMVHHRLRRRDMYLGRAMGFAEGKEAARNG